MKFLRNNNEGKLISSLRCSFPAFCASQKDSSVTLDGKLASQLEKTHVHSVYENIAGHFSETRHRKWPRVAEFVTSLPLGSILVDVGCGNGKYLGNSNLAEVRFRFYIIKVFVNLIN